MYFKERCVVIKQNWPLESDFLTDLDSFVSFAGDMRMPAGPNLKSNEKPGSPSDQSQYTKEFYLNIDGPEAISRVLRIADGSTSSVGNVAGLVPSFDA